MYRHLLLLIFCLLLSSFKYKGDKRLDSLKVQLSNIRNNKGVVYVFIYSYSNQYPYNPYKYFKFEKKLVKEGVLKLNVRGLEVGKQYVLTLIDDENSNEDLDRFLGLPKEGFGFSNNIKPFLSLPKYDDLVFEFKSSESLSIKVQYLL